MHPVKSGSWKISEPLPLGQTAKGRPFPVAAQSKNHFSSPHLVYFGPLLKSVRTLTYLDHRQGLKLNLSDRSSQRCLWWENTWDVSLQNSPFNRVLPVWDLLALSTDNISLSHRYHKPANMKPLVFSAALVQGLKLLLLWLLHAHLFVF